MVTEDDRGKGNYKEFFSAIFGFGCLSNEFALSCNYEVVVVVVVVVVDDDVVVVVVVVVLSQPLRQPQCLI